jgi:DASH complex subunit DAD2
MSYGSRPLPSHLRSGSLSNNPSTGSTGHSPALIARINEKKAELASLKELQALSAGLADQMEQLEQKLSTLNDGTEAVAAVLSNWHNVLRAISMASSKFTRPRMKVLGSCKLGLTSVVALPKPKEGVEEEETPLPQTLVRIPTHQVGLLPQSQGSGEVPGGGIGPE